MAIFNQFLIFSSVCAIFGFSSNLIWTSSFIPQVFRRSTEKTMNMVATLARKSTQNLDKVKEKYGGRADFESPLQYDDNEISSYTFFSEADEEEINPPTKGQIITGIVLEMDDSGALLEIGGKMSGYIPLKEAALIPPRHVNDVLEIGQSVTAEVIGTLKGMPVMSIRASEMISAWEKVLNTRAADSAFDVKVLEVNKGGAVCSAFGLKAFLPGSHLIGISDESLVGSTISVKFLEVNEDDGKLVISQRKAKTDNQIASFKRNQVVSGIITGLRIYGAFIELEGGMAGLLHISQISYDRVDNVENIFKIGQRVKVLVMDHDRLNNRVALSTKALEPNPGDMLKNMELVFEQAEESARKYAERLEEDRRVRENVAKDIVSSLGGVMDDSEKAVAAADSIESILSAIVSEAPESAPLEL